VASRVGGIPETARHEQEALLVAPGDVDDLHRALARLLSDPVLRRRLGAAAAARASAEFSIDRMTERYLELYGL
jgi:glycosyltransferase involved in cell wall biosynthesis